MWSIQESVPRAVEKLSFYSFFYSSYFFLFPKCSTTTIHYSDDQKKYFLKATVISDIGNLHGEQCVEPKQRTGINTHTSDHHSMQIRQKQLPGGRLD